MTKELKQKKNKVPTFIDVDFSDLNSPQQLNQKIWKYPCIKPEKINIRFDSGTMTYPNICAPISGVLDHYRKMGKEFIFSDTNSQDGYIVKTRFWEPYIVENTQPIDLDYPFDKVWQFSTPEGVQKIMNSFIKKIRCSAVVESGILQGITWCINEILDNVLLHADCDCGFIMGQIHKETHRVVISIFDNGRGILQSFRDSNYKPLPPTATDAIAIALQEKITRDQKIGQGNGMWGLAQIVKNNGGVLRVSSGGEGLVFEKNSSHAIPNRCVNMGVRHGSTLVDFQLDYSIPINVDAVLGTSMTNIWLEDHETISGSISYSVMRDCEGTGTRQAAERFRNIIINGFKENNSKIEIDFDGINFVSSSFSDELLGKLIVEFGFIDFLSIFELKNVSKQIKTTINRSIEQRFAQKYYDSSIILQRDVDA